MLATKELALTAGLCALFCVCGLECPASAQPARVEARQVCAVQDAIRWREAAWSPGYCEEVASTLTSTTNPTRAFARMINESDMRPKAIRVTIRKDGLLAYDVGAMAVRCLSYPWAPGVCINEPVRGLTVKRLQDIRTNVEKSEQILESHKGDERRYNGATTPSKGKRYVGKLDALEIALLGGVPKVKGARMRKLVRQIVEAMGKEPRS